MYPFSHSRPDNFSGTTGASKTRQLGFALLAGLSLTGSLAKPANGAGRNCDARPGDTMAANDVGRLYSQTVRKRGGYSVQRFTLCRYRDGKAAPIAEVPRRQAVYLAGFNVRWVFLVSEMAKSRRATDKLTRKSAVVVADTSRIGWVRGHDTRGYVWTAATIAPNGRVAGLLEGQGSPVPDERGNATTNNAAIVVFDPNGAPFSPGYPRPVIKTVATAPLGSITEFAATPNTIVWRTPAGIQTAPFAEPTAS